MSRNISVLFAGASIMAALSAAPALADSRFDGPYVGAAAGYSWAKPDSVATIPAVGREAVDKRVDGFSGVGFVGFGRTFDALYLGVEGEIGFTDAEATNRVGTNPYGFETGLTYGLSLRAGVLATPDTLIYGRVGWQRTELDIKSQLNNVVTIGGFIPRINQSQDLDGWRLGGGVERAIDDNLLARVEYNYTNYEDVTTFYTGNIGRLALSPDEHSVRVGLAYRF
jgi:outer membrane immunogenic protein